MDLLQRCVLIPLDIFKETIQNRPISTLLEAWLTFLGEDNPARLVELFEAFPQFVAMYETLYNMYGDMVKAMGFFSEELRIMDRNTAKYMIDEMDDEINLLQAKKNQLETEKSQLVAEKSQLETEKSQLETEKSQLETEKCRLETEKSQLEIEKSQLETQNIQQQSKINELLAELQRLQTNQQ